MKKLTASLRSLFADGTNRHGDRRQIISRSPFLLDDVIAFPALPWLGSIVSRLVESIIGLRYLHRRYLQLDPVSSPRQFIEAALKNLDIEYQTNTQEVEEIPRSGAAIVVANHPFGALDGLIATHILTGVRSDARVLVNHHLYRIEELRELFIPVDPYAGDGAIQRNRQPLSEALRWLQNGGLLLVFPAGEVAHFSFRHRSARESAWNPAVGRLAKLARAPVVPMFFHGYNSLPFQILGALFPRIRTLLLPRELIKKQNSRIKVSLGRAIPANRLQRLENESEISRYLRLRTRLLGEEQKATAIGTTAAGNDSAESREIITATPVELLQAEVAHLAPDQLLVEHEQFQVFVARAAQIPWLLQEIGRLRELTFRAVGEGTGKPVDLDLYDTYYLHLFIWQREKREIVGAYRLGRADEIVQRYGVKGLYTHSLFRYGSRLVEQLTPALELGRSFVQPAYQRHYASLNLLWKGIGAYLVRNPSYRRLFGPVSISSEYDPRSRQLLVDCLRLNNRYPDVRLKVRPRTPVPVKRKQRLPAEDLRCISDIELVSDLMAGLDPGQKGVPILIKQYLKLGGKFLEFNLDRSFNNAVDGLIVVDLEQTDMRLLQQYMGKTGAEGFLGYRQDNGIDFDKAS